MRQIALGSKNWLFGANFESGEQVARLKSVASSVNRNCHDVRKHLKDVLDRIKAGETCYAKLMNDAWKREHPKTIRAYREEKSRFKADQKQVTLARRIITAKHKRQR
jgi:hypothetical protein